MSVEREALSGNPSGEPQYFDEAERALNVNIPLPLKNMLTVNGFTNPQLLSQINDDDIQQMEQFMVDTLPSLIPLEDIEAYYGIFHKKPENFKLIPGHRKLLTLIINYFQRSLQLEEETNNVEGNIHNEKHNKAINNYQNKTSTSADGVALVSTQSTPVVNFNEENLHICRTVKNWIKTKCTSTDQWEYFKCKFSEISFESTYGSNNELFCIMTCFCKSSFKILKCCKGPNLAKRWMYGNFHKHLNKHLISDTSIIQTKSNSNVNTTKAPKENLLKYITRVTKTKTSKTTEKESNVSTRTRSEEKSCSHIIISPSISPVTNVTSKTLSLQKNVNILTNTLILPAANKMDNVDVSVEGNVGTVKSTEQLNLYEENKMFASESVTNKINILDDISNNEPRSEPVDRAVDGSRCKKLSTINRAINEINGSANAEDKVEKTVEENSRTFQVKNDYQHENLCATSKWKAKKYSRQERRKRKRGKEVKNQLPITSFFSFIHQLNNEVTKAIHENNDVGLDLTDAFQHIPKISDPNSYEPIGKEINPKTSLQSKTSIFFNLLQQIASRNSNRSTNRNNYNDDIKRISLYLYYIGGRLLYQTIHANMKNILPSISSLNRYVTESAIRIEEGFFDYGGLRKFLEERNLPKVVWISEDGTRVTGKPQYDPGTNKIVGFTLPLINGLPQTESFLATSAKAIKDAFEKGIKSNYAYLIMAQPLNSLAPAYCLSVFGTDNRFTATDVQHRWENIKTNAEKYGITVLGFSSDGDTRLLKAMKQNAVLPSLTTYIKTFKWDWFQSGYVKGDHPSYVQDTVHIGTKLRTRLLKPNIVLPMGKYFATPDHLKQLIKSFSKDKHLLVMTDLKAEDKMNFKAAEKICSPDVIQLLEEIPQSKATCEYLRIMNLALMSFLNTDCSIETRLYNIWYVVFFLRIWRQWLREQKEYKIGVNFITTNCYVCLELNAHSLIHIIVNFRENKSLSPDMFLPWLFSSQTCEKMFRAVRSMTSTFSTVVNFSVNDIMKRLDRIKIVNNIANDLKDVFVFPRETKKSRLQTTDDSDPKLNFNKCSDNWINTTVQTALHDAIIQTQNLGMIVEKDTWNLLSIPAVVEDLTVEDSDMDSVEDTQVDEAENIIDRDLPDVQLIDREFKEQIKINNLLPSEPEIQNTDLNNPKSDLYCDMYNISSLGIGNNLIMRDFSCPDNINLDQKKSLVKIVVGSKVIQVKKSSLCWLLEETRERVSTDRLRRFFANKNKYPQKSGTRDTRVAKKPKYETKVKLPESDSDTGSSYTETSSNMSIKYDDSTDTEALSENDSDPELNPESSPECSQLGSPKATVKNPEQSVSLDIQTKHQELFILNLIECDKFYAVYYGKTWYIGCVIKIYDKNLFQIKFLRKSPKIKNSFIWPKSKNDIEDVEREFIFYGPIEFNKNLDKNVEPFQLTDSDNKNIIDLYSAIKNASVNG